MRLEPVSATRGAADGGGKPVRTSKIRPFSPQLEKARARQRRPSAPKNVKKKEKKEISSFQKLNKSPRSADRNAELGDPGGPAPATPSSSSEPEGRGRLSTAGWILSGEQGLAEGPCVASVPFQKVVPCHRPSHSVQSLSPDHPAKQSVCFEGIILFKDDEVVDQGERT